MTQVNSGKKPGLVGAIFLVSGTTIGAGMLAQPVAASLIGFVPSLVMMGMAWFFMTSVALILLEVCMWTAQDTHIISMASRLLGKPGMLVSWVTYIFIAYLSLTAYVSGGGDIFSACARATLGMQLPEWLACMLFVVVFGCVIEIGSSAVGTVNSILVTGLIISYFAIVALGSQTVDLANLSSMRWQNSLMIVPLFLTSFSFQMIVPSLATYMNRDKKRLQIAIVGGTSLSFAIYVLWNIVVLGSVAGVGDESLALAYAEGRPPTQALGATGEHWFSILVHYFSFFALVTSFIGIAWGLFDFLADGFHIKKSGPNRIGLWLLVMVPTLVLALTYPRGFIGALESTGGYGDTILNGMIPILMFWVGYKIKKLPTTARFLKNPVFLCALLSFASIVVVIETWRHF